MARTSRSRRDASLGATLATAILCSWLGFGESRADTQPSQPQTASALLLPHEKYRLANGLEVILHRDTRLPMVAVNLWYHVGATHEPRGRSGFAHLFEHLMFEGSQHAGNQFDRLLEAVGGTNMNGTTSWDRTNYYETVPSEHLELALWLEADRMGFMIDSLTRDRFEVQRGVVENERRESYENAPYGQSWLRLYEELFPEGHPYRGAVIGSMEDLRAATMTDVGRFFTRFYAPGNATLCLAGNFDTQSAKAMIEKHFATLPARGSRVKARTELPEPRPTGKRAVVVEPVELAQVIWAWLAPPAYSDDQLALTVALDVLGSGKASRLYRGLVATGLANWVDITVDDNELLSIVSVDVGIASEHSVQEIETRLDEVISSLAQRRPSKEEMRRARIGYELGLQSELQLLNSSGGEGGRAGLLQRLNHYLGDPGALPDVVQRRARVSAERARVAAQRFLDPDVRTTIITVPEVDDE